MWIKLDDGFATHPKALAAGPRALALQIRAICYASQHQTDGFIARAVLPFLEIDLDVDSDGEVRIKEDWPVRMVQYGFWEVHEQGWQIHDYLEWNLSKKELKTLKSDKMRAGKKGAKVRWNKRIEPMADAMAPANSRPMAPLSNLILSNLVSSSESENRKESERTNTQKTSLSPERIEKTILQLADKVFPPIP